MSDWVRKRFAGVGLTQSPPGPYFDLLRAKYRGLVLLCIDVSGSMSGDPLQQAIAGGEQFFNEAFEAGYDCGLVLWNHQVAAYAPVGTGRAELLGRLRGARSGGGTALLPTLELAKRDLAAEVGDRVLCIFSDGGVGDRGRAVAAARELCARGVRIVVRGLGPHASQALSELMCPGQREESSLIEDVDAISTGIASMAEGLTAGRTSLTTDR
jgi:Mg-chelatase subunit ChlD